MDRLVGTGGWGYFHVPGEDPLAAYVRGFGFVEVNSTFYEDPDPRTVAGWRRKVPASFRFAVRAHRDLTHRHRLRPTPGARAALARTARIAVRLRAVAIVLETPATVGVEPAGFGDLLAAVDLPCPVALEARAYAGRDLPSRLAATMESHDVADVVDFSRQEPRTDASLAYGRMFGLAEGNRWEFTDDELAGIRDRPEKGDQARAVYTFHGVRMYKDAARFLTFVRTGTFPRATRHAGLASLDEVLSQDARFPATKADLVRDFGWRVIDATTDRRAHAADLLTRLPNRRFGALDDVLSALRKG